MFTGIIEEVGIVQSLNVTGGFSSDTSNSGESLVKKTNSESLSASSGCSILIQAKTVIEGTKIGDSIAVNGVCLTVTSIRENSFTADIMAESLRRSNLGSLSQGSKVNLERAMSVQGRFGGHIVSGHIDGTGNIVRTKNEGHSIWVYISAPEQIIDLIVEKGSITVDGVSLTVALVTEKEFAVSIIPHTQDETTLVKKKMGEKVNLENDIVGKYVQKLMSKSAKNKIKQEAYDSKILSWLQE
ncbi:MAG: riboflavin synthase [Treponemataceae bacterium]